VHRIGGELLARTALTHDEHIGHRSPPPSRASRRRASWRERTRASARSRIARQLSAAAPSSRPRDAGARAPCPPLSTSPRNRRACDEVERACLAPRTPWEWRMAVMMMNFQSRSLLLTRRIRCSRLRRVARDPGGPARTHSLPSGAWRVTVLPAVSTSYPRARESSRRLSAMMGSSSDDQVRGSRGLPLRHGS